MAIFYQTVFTLMPGLDKFNIGDILNDYLFQIVFVIDINIVMFVILQYVNIFYVDIVHVQSSTSWIQ